MESDNFTALTSSVYDIQIRSTIPYYDCFHSETIGLVKSIMGKPEVWLDTGCGTGNLTEKALKVFNTTRFLLTDPSGSMLSEAKTKFSGNNRVIFLPQAATQDLTSDEVGNPDVITAIQAHHYLSSEERIKATQTCYDLLRENGLFITFENISPGTEMAIALGKKRWLEFEMDMGKDYPSAKNHVDRFGTEFYPVTVEEHLNLLRSCGFKVVEILWCSYMQAGFYCIK